MELDLKKLSNQSTESTGIKKKMRLSENASSMVFRMFTSTIYSNPIGTVVREITSNCFDSHIEAGVNAPILIKKTVDKTDNSIYISFIDYGVGMSPDRVENVYGVYFESTKRTNNNEIGGFGIGGKTPLAYKRSTGQGEGEYDNSFFAITIHDGVKYIYNIFEGEEAPEFTLLHQEATTEHNGTEIRIPILEKDVDRFENEMIKQLYYFENLVFEGFSEDVSNDYQIIRGKNFLYRGENLGSFMHVCLGKVAYPITYDVLGLNQYDYQIPVALNVPIGDIGVVASREQLDYSEATIKYLKAKLETVKGEMKGMLEKQYENVRTLEDYFKVKSQFGILYLSDTKSVKVGNILKAGDIDYSNYKFSLFKTPNDRQLLDLMFNVKVYGAKELKDTWRNRNNNNYHQLNHSYEGIQKADNVYFLEDYQITLKRIKQAYLRNEHGRFYIISPKDFLENKSDINDMFKTDYDDSQTKLTKQFVNVQKQYMDIVRKYTDSYLDVDVPEDFVLESKKPKLSQEIKNSTISVKIVGGYSRTRVKISELMKFNGIVFYGTSEEEFELRNYRQVFTALYGSKHLSTSYNTWSGEKYKFGENNGVVFLQLGKANIKYMQYCKQALPIEKFYQKMVYRKADQILTYFKNTDVVERYDNIDLLYKHEQFKEISTKWAKRVKNVQAFVNEINDNNFSGEISYHKNFFKRYLALDSTKLSKEEKRMRKNLTAIEELQEKNLDVLQYVSTPSYSSDTMEDTQILILQTVMSV